MAKPSSAPQCRPLAGNSEHNRAITWRTCTECTWYQSSFITFSFHPTLFGCYMATSLDKSKSKVLIHHLHPKRFHMVKRLQKSVQYIRRYLTKYAEPLEHATQFPFVSLFSAATTGPIFTKILHVIVAFVMLLYFAYTRRYPILLPNGIATK